MRASRLSTEEGASNARVGIPASAVQGHRQGSSNATLRQRREGARLGTLRVDVAHSPRCGASVVLIYGIGQSPFAMVQPGVVSNPILNNANYLYTSIVDENGTVYVLGDNSNRSEERRVGK